MASNSLLIPFDNFPRERDYVGKMLIAYGEIEFAFFDIMSAVLKNAQTAVRTLYQLRSETHRLAVIEAIATPWMQQAGLAGQFKEAVDAAHWCKTIRNQYAHCTWMADGPVLRFCNLEETAKSKGAECKVRAQPITLDILQEQWAYFEYADHQILWVDYSYRLKNKQPTRTDRAFAKPKRIPPPKLNSRGRVPTLQ